MTNPMSRLVRAQLMRALGGRGFPALAVVAAVLCSASVLGTGKAQATAVAAHTVTVAAAESRLANLGFGSLIFATIAGLLLSTSEFRSGAVVSSAIVARGPQRLLAAKLLAVLVSGAAFGLVGVATGAGGAMLWADYHHLPFVWSASLLTRLGGVFLVSLLAGPWGVALGWAGRKQLPTLLAVILWTLAVETALIALVPDFGQWLPGGAQAAIYGDLDTHHLGMAAGVVLFAGWTAVAVAAGNLITRRRGLT